MSHPKYQIAMNSIIGTREEQQDYALCKVDGNRAIAIVCDGMGGLAGGTLASKMAAEKLTELYMNKNFEESVPEFFLKSIDILDELIFNLKNENGEKLNAGTTLVAAVIEKDNLYWLSAGDSRLYILRGCEFIQVTRDHNYFLILDQMIKNGEISEKQYDLEAVKGEALISFIGVGGIEVMDNNDSPLKLLHDDVILLSSDGLHKALMDDETAQILKMPDIEESMDALMANASENARMSQDNTTCIIIRYARTL